jgi:hypothetical protein
MPSIGHYNLSILHLLLASFMYLFTRYKKCCTLAAVVPTPSSLFFGGIANITDDMPDEQRLFYTLMTRYEKAVRPTQKASDAVIVKLGITLTQILDIVNSKDKKNQIDMMMYF